MVQFVQPLCISLSSVSCARGTQRWARRFTSGARVASRSSTGTSAPNLRNSRQGSTVFAGRHGQFVADRENTEKRQQGMENKYKRHHVFDIECVSDEVWHITFLTFFFVFRNVYVYPTSTNCRSINTRFQMFLATTVE